MTTQPPQHDPWRQQPSPQQPYRPGPPAPRSEPKRTRINVALYGLSAVCALAAMVILLAAILPDPKPQAAPAPAAADSTDAAAPLAGEPKTAASAKVAALRSLDAYAAGDWEAAWDEWVPEAKKLITRDQYVRLHTECKTLVGIPFTIKAVRVEGSTATVRVNRAGIVFTEKLRYLDGAWRYQPRPENMADYRLGVDRLIAKLKATPGRCSS